MKFEIRTLSEANQREFWRTRQKRKKYQQETFALLWRSYRPKVELPATITFTRHSCMTLDDDNLRSAFKAIRDQLAKEIGVDDADPRVKWEYAQVRLPKRLHYFTIDITPGKPQLTPSNAAGDR